MRDIRLGFFKWEQTVTEGVLSKVTEAGNLGLQLGILRITV